MQRDAEYVKSANKSFYEALSGQDLLGMEKLWSHAAHVRCVHAGWSMLQGWDAIRESWRAIFQQALALTVEADDAGVAILGRAAVVTCRERITSFTLEGSKTADAEATNVFEKEDGRWVLIHHHSSPITMEKRSR